MNAMNHVAAAVASLDYDRLLVAMTNACRVTGKRNTLPILDHVTITASRGGAQVCGTDLDRYFTTFVPGQVDKGFACILDAHKLLAVLKKAKAARTVNLSVDGDQVVMSIGKLNVTTTPTASIDDVPQQKFREGLKKSNCSFILKAEVLARILQRVTFAVSTEETRYYLNGTFMHVVQRAGYTFDPKTGDPSNTHLPKLTFAATDGHRLARYEIDVPAGAEAMPDEGVIIPRIATDELSRLLKRKGCPAEIMVTVTDTGISFLIGEDELLESKLIEGTFPDYTRVLPSGNDHRLEIMPSLLIEAVTQASTILTERGRAVRLKLGDGWLRASCKDPEFGTTEMTIAAENETPLEIGFNVGYLLEVLARVEGKAVIKFADCGAPVLVSDTDDDCVLYCLMPMRV
ncbi:DNA polymerase III subunit beta [Aquibium microcysteis]|uniref:DNA polymerase III subunit beta n=1 Tax=Aquibium microcysteis TaxID=675281 RepID=UPI00165D0440|nr:DNA polymerase III subunit beta [Aquibium microcysteis]